MNIEIGNIKDFAGINIPAVQPDFFYLGQNRSAIATVATDPFGASPTLSPFEIFQFEYWLGLTNSSTGAITLGWGGATVTRLIADVVVLPAANGTAYVGVNPFTSTTNKAITGGTVAATHWIKIKGFVVNSFSIQRLPIQVSVASGTITPQAGSWLRFVSLGVSESGTSNFVIGDVR